MPFEKGNLANPGGRPHNAESLVVHLRAVVAEIDDATGKSKARLLAEALVEIALDPKARWRMSALTAIRDSLDGKPDVAVRHLGDEEHPVRIVVATQGAEGESIFDG